MSKIDGLAGYQQRRLELADMIRAVLPIARAHGDEQREQQIRTLLTRLASGRFRVKSLAMRGLTLGPLPPDPRILGTGDWRPSTLA